MSKSVACLTDARKVRGPNAGLTQRHKPLCSVPVLCRLDPANTGPAVVQIIARIQELERARGCGAYLFITPELDVYVISEARDALIAKWTREHFRWWVAFYKTIREPGKRAPVLAPTFEGVTEDVSEHLDDLRRLPA